MRQISLRSLGILLAVLSLLFGVAARYSWRWQAHDLRTANFDIQVRIAPPTITMAGRRYTDAQELNRQVLIDAADKRPAGRDLNRTSLCVACEGSLKADDFLNTISALLRIDPENYSDRVPITRMSLSVSGDRAIFLDVLKCYDLRQLDEDFAAELPPSASASFRAGTMGWYLKLPKQASGDIVTLTLGETAKQCSIEQLPLLYKNTRAGLFIQAGPRTDMKQVASCLQWFLSSTDGLPLPSMENIVFILSVENRPWSFQFMLSRNVEGH